MCPYIEGDPGENLLEICQNGNHYECKGFFDLFIHDLDKPIEEPPKELRDKYHKSIFDEMDDGDLLFHGVTGGPYTSKDRG